MVESLNCRAFNPFRAILQFGNATRTISIVFHIIGEKNYFAVKFNKFYMRVVRVYVRLRGFQLLLCENIKYTNRKGSNSPSH